MKKLGILINNLGHSQLSYIISKRIIENSQRKFFDDIVLFYSDIVPSLFPIITATMQISECWLYNAPCVATDISSAKKLINIFGPTKKFFYSYNLEWIRPEQFRYEDFANVYCSSELEIIARNEDHAKIIENCFNRKSHILNELNLDELQRIING